MIVLIINIPYNYGVLHTYLLKKVLFLWLMIGSRNHNLLIYDLDLND